MSRETKKIEKSYPKNINQMRYSITRIQKYKLKHEKKTKYPLEELRKFNGLDLMFLEDYLELYKIMENYTLEEFISALERICSIILRNGHLDPQVSDECIEEKLCRHYNEKKYTIILAIDQKDIEHYMSKEEERKMFRAGGKKRRKRLWERYTYENPLNRIHGLLIYDQRPGPQELNQDERAISIEAIGSNPYASMNGLKAIGSYLLLYIIMLAKIQKFDKVILEIANDKAELIRECDINSLGENDDEDMRERRRELEGKTVKKLKKIARGYYLPLGGLKLHFINRILWEE